MTNPNGRRAFLSAAAAGTFLAACRRTESVPGEGAPLARTPEASAIDGAEERDAAGGEEVGATEDLMREHGVIRRVLVVYREVAARLHARPEPMLFHALQDAARLMRTFGEEYHEKELEEASLFPALRKRGGAIVTTIDALVVQHARGREITEYVLSVSAGAIGAHAAEPLARTLEGFARMYEEHAAIEDTVVFPAWKKLFTAEELDAIGDRFEDIEHRTFGGDGFEDAVSRVAAIERALGIDLAGMLAPPPPRP
jgi:hemerythrin-like domain-containing protein